MVETTKARPERARGANGTERFELARTCTQLHQSFWFGAAGFARALEMGGIEAPSAGLSHGQRHHTGKPFPTFRAARRSHDPAQPSATFACHKTHRRGRSGPAAPMCFVAGERGARLSRIMTATCGAKRWKWFAGVVALAMTQACAGRFDPAHFQGTREARRAEPEALVELSARTSELETLGTIRATCSLRPGFRRLDHEKLSDFDCSNERLLFALRESAANAGGEALLGAHCSSRPLGSSAPAASQLSCAAEVA